MGIFYTTLWSRPTQFSVSLFRIQCDWIRTKSSTFAILKYTNVYLWLQVGILFTCINTSFDSLSTEKQLLFLIYRGVLWQGVQLTETNPFETSMWTGVIGGGRGWEGGIESSVHVCQSRRFTWLLLYRRLQFVSSLQNNFRMTFPILPLSHIYLWLKWSWISRAEVGKDSLFERGCAHVCSAFGFYDVVGKGKRRLLSHSFLRAARPLPLPQLTSHMNNVQHIERVFGSAHCAS